MNFRAQSKYMYLLQICLSYIYREWIRRSNTTDKTEQAFCNMVYEKAVYLKAYPISLTVSSGLVRDAASPCSVRPSDHCDYSNPLMLAQITALLGILLHSLQANMGFINCWSDKQVTEGRCFLLFAKAVGP